MVAWHLYLNQVDVKAWTRSTPGPEGHMGKYPVHPPDSLHPWLADCAYILTVCTHLYVNTSEDLTIYSITSNPHLTLQENPNLRNIFACYL